MDTTRADLPWSYPAKLLLFGEYAVLDGGVGLACSWPSRGARWVAPLEAAGQGTPDHGKSDHALTDHVHLGPEPRDPEGPDTRREQLNAFVAWLDTQPELVQRCGLDLARLKADLDAGWWLAGDLPAGYGVGSSGVAVAGLVDRYADWNAVGSAEMQARFAALEAHFHGQSSGLDPLVSYLGRARLGGNPRRVWLRYGGSGLPQVVEPKTQPNPQWTLFLLDTGRPRRTEPLVSAFRERRAAEPDYARRLEQELASANTDAVEAFLAGVNAPFAHALERLSRLSLELLEPMVPEALRGLWAEGLEARPLASPFLLKLCGAGGGGYLFAWSANPDAAREALADWPLLEVGRF